MHALLRLGDRRLIGFGWAHFGLPPRLEDAAGTNMRLDHSLAFERVINDGDTDGDHEYMRLESMALRVVVRGLNVFARQWPRNTLFDTVKTF
jgi:hypothetical protein